MPRHWTVQSKCAPDLEDGLKKMGKAMEEVEERGKKKVEEAKRINERRGRGGQGEGDECQDRMGSEGCDERMARSGEQVGEDDGAGRPENGQREIRGARKGPGRQGARRNDGHLRAALARRSTCIRRRYEEGRSERIPGRHRVLWESRTMIGTFTVLSAEENGEARVSGVEGLAESQDFWVPRGVSGVMESSQMEATGLVCAASLQATTVTGRDVLYGGSGAGGLVLEVDRTKIVHGGGASAERKQPTTNG